MSDNVSKQQAGRADIDVRKALAHAFTTAGFERLTVAERVEWIVNEIRDFELAIVANEDLPTT